MPESGSDAIPNDFDIVQGHTFFCQGTTIPLSIRSKWYVKEVFCEFFS